MVYQSSNARVMSKSTQVTNKQSHSHPEENSANNNINNKKMLSSAKSSACASQHHHLHQQQQSHHSSRPPTHHEYVNVKSPSRRISQQPIAQNPAKALYRSESMQQHRSQAMMMSSSSAAAGAGKSRNDHKNDSHQQDSNRDMNRACHESRHNGNPMTDIYADDAAEVKANKQTILLFSVRRMSFFSHFK